MAFYAPPGGLAPGGGGGGGAPAQGYATAGAVPRSLQVFPPEYFPIVGAQEFRVNQTGASGGVGTVTPAAFVTRVPERYVGILRVFGYGLLAMTNATDVAWRLLVNDAPVAGYEFRFFPGVVPRINATEDIYLRLPEGSKIGLAFVNTDGAAYTFGAQYSGWFWQQAAGDAWTGEAFSG